VLDYVIASGISNGTTGALALVDALVSRALRSGEALRLIEAVAQYGEGKNPDMDTILGIIRQHRRASSPPTPAQEGE
jgi:hypothetical protein